VLCALDEAIDGLDLNDVGVYIGVSAGATIASLLANGVSARELSRAILEQSQDESLNLHPEELFTPAWGEYLDRVLRLPGIAYRTTRRLLSGRLGRLGWGLLSELGPAVPTAIFDGRGMERYLAKALAKNGRTNDFRRLDTALRIVAVRLDTSELVAFGSPELEHVPISKAVQASTALPGMFCPVEIDGEMYIDGVARRTMNASLGLQYGAGLMICVNPIVPVRLSPEDENRRRRTLIDHGLPGVLSQTFRTVIHSRMSSSLKNYAHLYPDADLLLIEPEMEDHSLFFSNIFSFTNRRQVCEHAYAHARRYLLREADRLVPMFKRHGLTLRRDILEDRSRTLYPRELPADVTHAATQTLARLERALDGR
jgi:predicted acylesterase/phospholipase RssA